MGGNPAENHPCGFKWALEAKKTRGAKIVAVDPRFTRTAAVADLYSPLRVGSDIAYLYGIIRYAVETKRYHEDYVKAHTNAAVLINESFGFSDGLFSGFNPEKGEYGKETWAYQLDDKKFAKTDPTLSDPRCVFQLLKHHVDRYTPEMVERVCGTPKDTFLKVAETVTSTGNAERAGTIMYALGWTQHSTGVQMIRAAAILQLLLGNVGRPGGGVNALRGHSNIQGATDLGGTFEILPGYLKTPQGQWTSLKEYLEANTPKPLAAAAMNYWQNTPKFTVSLLKAAFGKAATKENDFGYDWLPKVDGNYSWMYIFDDMYRGSSTRAGGQEPGPEGFITFGMNPVGIGPNSRKMVAALSKLKWMVVVENVETEAAGFWKAPPELGGAKPADIGTEVFLLPAANFAEKDGSFTNSARWLQWKWKAVDPPGQAKSDQEILARLFVAVRQLYRKEGGSYPDPILNIAWAYANPVNPDLADVLKEINGKALEDLHDVKDKTKVVKTAGQQLDGFGQLADDGSTSCGNWLYSGAFTEAGNNTQRRNNADATGLGMFHNWAFSWPANRRVMYNRASADAAGAPWDPTRVGIQWKDDKWVGDVPDIKPDSPPGTYGAFIMIPEGLGRLFAPTLSDGPFPEHYEAIEPLVDNPLHPKVTSNPVSKRFSSDKDLYGKRDEFPIVCTTYRLTEHFHYWTQHQHQGRLNEIQPGFFFEIPEDLAHEKGIANGSKIKVTSARGSIEGPAMVTRRLRALTIDGKQTWQIGFPIHWGYAGDPAHVGPLANLLTPSAMDPNTWTPEFKTFLVKLEKV
ncbi:MAG TPA: formate dehydrogenase-N subunit alpha, partial [Candidatus Sulfotelmatobacter sp.]|nr:formate dehydrogenase-N subunit alpha [Candidatus Sulfotelmatobacter sp.]